MPDLPLRMRDLCARYGVDRRTIHRWIKDRGFPPGVGFGGRGGKRWTVAVVERWEASAVEVSR